VKGRERYSRKAWSRFAFSVHDIKTSFGVSETLLEARRGR